MAKRFFDDKNRDEKFLKDVAYLSKTFDPYKRRYESLDKVLNPDVPTENQGINQSLSSDLTVDAAMRGAAKPFSAKYRTNFVQTGSRSLINRMDRSEIIIEVHLDGKNKEQLDKADLLEDFNLGLISKLNDEVASYGEGTGLTYKIFESIVNRGKAISRVQMRKEGGVTVPVWELYNPYGCFHTFRSPQFRFGYQSVRSPEEVVEMIEGMEDAVGSSLPIPGIVSEASQKEDGLTVTEYLMEETLKDRKSVWAGLMVNNHVIYLRETSFKRRNVIITSINAASSKLRNAKMYGNTNVYTSDSVENHAVPWYVDAENPIGLYNTEYSILLAAGALAAMPPVAIKGPDNQTLYVIGGQDIHSPGAKVYLTNDQAVQAINIAQAGAADHKYIVDGLQRELEYVMAPEVRGREPFAGASGYLFDRMEDTQKNMMVNVFKGGSLHLKQGLRELCQQFIDAGDLEIRLNARAKDGANQGKFYPRNFSKQDFPDAWDFDVIIDPMVASNDAARIQIATTAVQAGLTSKQTAMGQYMKQRHPIQEQERIDADRIHDVLLLETAAPDVLRDEIQAIGERIERARRENRQDDADAMELKQAALQIKLKRIEGGGGQPNQGTPAKPDGFRPEVVPPQETTKNPQNTAAAKGKPSVGMNGQGKGGMA